MSKCVVLVAFRRASTHFSAEIAALVGWPAPFFPGCVRASRALRYLATGGFLLWNWQLLTPEENQHIWLLTAKEKGKTIIIFFFFFILLFKLSGGRHCLRLGDPHY